MLCKGCGTKTCEVDSLAEFSVGGDVWWPEFTPVYQKCACSKCGTLGKGKALKFNYHLHNGMLQEILFCRRNQHPACRSFMFVVNCTSTIELRNFFHYYDNHFKRFDPRSRFFKSEEQAQEEAIKFLKETNFYDE